MTVDIVLSGGPCHGEVRSCWRHEHQILAYGPSMPQSATSFTDDVLPDKLDVTIFVYDVNWVRGIAKFNPAMSGLCSCGQDSLNITDWPAHLAAIHRSMGAMEKEKVNRVRRAWDSFNNQKRLVS